jgi:hypothetical protein
MRCTKITGCHKKELSVSVRVFNLRMKGKKNMEEPTREFSEVFLAVHQLLGIVVPFVLLLDVTIQSKAKFDL